MISRLLPPLVAPVSNAANAHSKKGDISDFSAVLDAPTTVEAVPFRSGDGHPRASSQPADVNESLVSTPGALCADDHLHQLYVATMPHSIVPAAIHPLPAPVQVANDGSTETTQPLVQPSDAGAIATDCTQELVSDLALPTVVPTLPTEPMAAHPWQGPSVEPARPAQKNPASPVQDDTPLHSITDEVAAPALSTLNVSSQHAVTTELAARPASDPVTILQVADIEQMPSIGEFVQLPDIHCGHTTMGGEQVELDSIPWRLQANAGLSYRTVETDVRDDGVGLHEMVPLVAHANSMPLVRGFTFAPFSASSSIAEWLASLQPIDGSSAHGGSAGDDPATAEVGTAARTETVATSLAWPERLLRWLADSNSESATAWVRDYQLAPSQAGGLIDALRLLATQQGFSLDRIMLNGHELWRTAPAPHLTPGNP